MKLEHKVLGVAACQQLFRDRPSDVIRAYITEERLALFRGQLKTLAASKRAYHVVTEEEILKVTEGNLHSEGICLLVKAKSTPLPAAWIAQLQKRNGVVLVLEGIENPHNLGAIARVAAHFGVLGVILVHKSTPAFSPLLNPTFYRTAEGGAEATEILELTSEELPALHKQLVDEDYVWVATSSHSKNNLFQSQLPPKMVLMLGSESQGLSLAAQGLAQLHLNIQGTGKVESLNVSTAAAVFLGVWAGKNCEKKPNQFQRYTNEQSDAASLRGPLEKLSGRVSEADSQIKPKPLPENSIPRILKKLPSAKT